MSTEQQDLEEIRSLTIQALKYFNSSQYNPNSGGGRQITALKREVEKLATHKGLIPSSTIQGQYNKLVEQQQLLFLESVHNLLIQGVIMWGHEVGNPQTGHYPFFSITTYGKKVLESGELTPHDPDRYISEFQSRVPNVDKIILLYITESLQCYLRNNLIASSVMLGVASEAAFNMLFEKFEKALTDPNKEKKFSKLNESIHIKNKFDEIRKEIILIKNKLPQNIGSDLELHLNGIFTLIRLQRNDSGHPTGKIIE